MVAIVTPRLFLVSTPLSVIEARMQLDEFVAEVPITVEDAGRLHTESMKVRFPAEWPGDAVALLPHWRKRMQEDPTFEMLGGTMIHRADLVAVGQMTVDPVADQPGTLELGYGVNPAYQGQGLATEAARALVARAASEPRVLHIIAGCLTANIPSSRVLEKAGFRRTDERMTDEGPSIWWEYPMR